MVLRGEVAGGGQEEGRTGVKSTGVGPGADRRPTGDRDTVHPPRREHVGRLHGTRRKLLKERVGEGAGDTLPCT